MKEYSKEQLEQCLEKLKREHERLSIEFDKLEDSNNHYRIKTVMEQIESLTPKIDILLFFLENHGKKSTDSDS